MRISHVRIDNYRNIKHADVELSNIVALIGENNSGKSNFLRAIALPLSSDEGSSKRLSWYDINKEAKHRYYDFLKDKKSSIVDASLTVGDFCDYIPCVQIQLFLKPEGNEHYNVNDILVSNDDFAGEGDFIGGIQYRFFVKKPEELFARVKSVLADEEALEDDVQMSLLPMELYDYSITVPSKESKVSYDTLSKFRAVNLPAERDNFASNADRLGSKALSDILQKAMSSDSQVKIEKAYKGFFDTVKSEGKLDTVLNWQEYSDIENAQEFFQQISVLPNMPPMSSILGSIRLGYEEENMFLQGLGHRNLILMTVLLNSYISKERDLSFRLMAVEEPEAHLCISNVLLVAKLFNIFSQKNGYTQIVYSTHNAELVNKIGLDKVIILHNGEAIALSSELTSGERDYLAANPNTDIFKLLYSRKTILVEGITEELLIKAYLQIRSDLNDIKVLSFHKGFTKIVEIWKKVNTGSDNKLGIVRDFDNQPGAQANHEELQNKNVIVRTTKGYTLETDITNANYEILKAKYGEEYGWNGMTADELQMDWRTKKSDVMLRICHDLVNGELEGFIMPKHIQEIIDFMQGEAYES